MAMCLNVWPGNGASTLTPVSYAEFTLICIDVKLIAELAG